MVRPHGPEKNFSSTENVIERISDGESAELEKDDVEIPVSFLKLFRFATRKDYSLIILAVLAALGTGPCLSIAVILFGDLANVFVNNAGDLAQNVSQTVCSNEAQK